MSAPGRKIDKCYLTRLISALICFTFALWSALWLWAALLNVRAEKLITLWEKQPRNFNEQLAMQLIPRIKQSLLLNPLDASNHFLLARLYEQLGNNDLAEEQYQLALANQPTSDYTWARLANFYSNIQFAENRDLEQLTMHALAQAMSLGPYESATQQVVIPLIFKYWQQIVSFSDLESRAKQILSHALQYSNATLTRNSAKNYENLELIEGLITNTTAVLAQHTPASVVPGSEQFGATDYVPLTTFDSDPMAAGWQKSNSSAAWSEIGHLDATLGGWYSPVFNPTPGEYYRIQYDVRLTGTGKAQLGTFFGNPDATYDLEPANSPLYRTTSTGSQVISGQLLADNYTSIQPAGSSWATITEFTRVPANATQSFIYFGKDSTGALIDNVRISSATRAEVLAWADSIYNNPGNFPAKPGIVANPNRFANLPNTYSRLTHGQMLNVVMLGDSIVGDTENSTLDVLIERNFPGTRVRINSAVGHGTSLADWLYSGNYDDWRHNGLKLQEAVYDLNPDLVVIGGISNGNGLAATQTIVQALKALGAEVLLTTGDFGNTLNASKFAPIVNGSTTGNDPTLSYRNAMYNLAMGENVGFLDTYGEWGTYLLKLRAAGMTDDDYYRDHWTHANTIGKQMVGRIYETFFTPLPE